MHKTSSENGEKDLSSTIDCLKSTLICFNVVQMIFGAAMFGVSLWLCVEPSFKEWIIQLRIQKYYVGIYVIIVAAVIIMLVSLLGCAAALMELRKFVGLFIITQVLSFILGLAGSAVLLDHSTFNSKIQPMIRTTMRDLISNSHYEQTAITLSMIQENIGCCGADGPEDFINLMKPLPSECRDTVTGNAFFYGCVDEVTWFLEDKSAWLAGLTLTVCLINVINIVLSTVFVQALKRDERP